MKTRRKKQEEREAMKSEDTVKETEKERGDPRTRRKMRSPLCF